MMTANNTEKTKVVVVGTGDKARGLANMYQCNASKDIYQFVLTEPLPTRPLKPFNEYVSVEDFPAALEKADVIILAIPSYAIKSFLVKTFSLLKEGCILVDATNDNQHKEDLMGALTELDLVADFDRWCKAFNDVGAIQELQYEVSSKEKLHTKMCGPSPVSVQKVSQLAEALGFSVKTVPIDQFEKVRVSQETIGWEWIHATVSMIVLFALVTVYVIVQAHNRPHFEWYTLLGRHSSKVFAWTATYGLALSLLPGTLARMIHQIQGTTAPIPRVLLWGCIIRKQIGLLSLYFLFLHACMMMILFGNEYFGYLMQDGSMNWEGEASMLFAAISTSLFGIVGIVSLPSVGHAMNKAQFGLVFGPVVWGALATGLLHIMFLGVSRLVFVKAACT